MQLITVMMLIFLVGLVNGSLSKREQAQLRASLANADSIAEAMHIVRNTGPRTDGTAILSSVSWQEEEEPILGQTRESNRNSSLIIRPRNGGCEPRVICEEVPQDYSKSDVTPYPLCVEIHRCGGCCHEAPFPCMPVQEVAVTFSPLLQIYVDGSKRIEKSRPLTLMNHTKCQCKCNKNEAECRNKGKELDPVLCECVRLRCSPRCIGFAKCSIVSGSSIPRCVCDESLEDQSDNFCPNSEERPDAMCTRCEKPSSRRNG